MIKVISKAEYNKLIAENKRLQAESFKFYNDYITILGEYNTLQKKAI